MCFFKLPIISKTLRNGAKHNSDHNNALIVGKTSFEPVLMVAVKGVIIWVKIAVLTL